MDRTASPAPKDTNTLKPRRRRLSRHFRRAATCLAGLVLYQVVVVQSLTAIADDAEQPADVRLRTPRNIYDENHPWTPPNSLADWETEREHIRRQMLVATGLWPMPEKTPLEPVVHGSIDRGDYVVEKVYFASMPGLYVTGNLYRPKEITGKVPGVLCPHGHWANGRFYDSGENARKELESGAETYMSGARYPLQARMVQLARMGCIVFHYDMVGYADSFSLEHRTGFNDAQAAGWLHGQMALQTWNSIRALDFLMGLPDVDTNRIGVTGASGGGTQTFILCAIDPRPTVAFPAVMVSAAMQGGCVCENACYLRQDINNVAFAALFAPKPLGMSAADDWTVDIENRGLPELKQIYSLYQQPTLVHAERFKQFGHNYNEVSREVMFHWFREYLQLGDVSAEQPDFWPIPPKELTVFDENYPRPDDALNTQELRKQLRERDHQQLADLQKNDPQEYHNVIAGAAAVMLSDVPHHESASLDLSGLKPMKGNSSPQVFQKSTVLSVDGTRIPVTVYSLSETPGKTGVLWLDDPQNSHLLSDGKLTPQALKLLQQHSSLITAKLFLAGDADAAKQHYDTEEARQSPGLYYAYNRPLLTQRVRDIRHVAQALQEAGYEKVTLLGTGSAGLPALLAAATLPTETFSQVAVDLQNFQFASISDVADPNFLPGALKYGGVGGLASLAFPTPLAIYGASDSNAELEPLKATYAAQPDRLQQTAEPLTGEAITTALEK